MRDNEEVVWDDLSVISAEIRDAIEHSFSEISINAIKEKFHERYKGVQMNKQEIRNKGTRNPAHYCLNCLAFLGHRGFCNGKCHDDWYAIHSELHS